MFPLGVIKAEPTASPHGATTSPLPKQHVQMSLRNTDLLLFGPEAQQTEAGSQVRIKFLGTVEQSIDH